MSQLSRQDEEDVNTMTVKEQADRFMDKYHAWREIYPNPTLEEHAAFMETVRLENFVDEENFDEFRKSTKIMCGLTKGQLAMVKRSN